MTVENRLDSHLPRYMTGLVNYLATMAMILAHFGNPFAPSSPPGLEVGLEILAGLQCSSILAVLMTVAQDLLHVCPELLLVGVLTSVHLALYLVEVDWLVDLLEVVRNSFSLGMLRRPEGCDQLRPEALTADMSDIVHLIKRW